MEMAKSKLLKLFDLLPFPQVHERTFPAFGGHELVETTGTMEWKIENLKADEKERKKKEKEKRFSYNMNPC